MTGIAYLWQHHKGALFALGLALIVAGFFGVRLVVQWVYWSDPAHRDQVIEGWMSPGYVGHSYHVSKDVILGALPPITTAGKRLTLDQIANDNGMTTQQLIDALTVAIEAERSARD